MNLKTVIILIVLAVPVGYSLKKLFGMFKKNGGGCECSSCPMESKNCCSSKK